MRNFFISLGLALEIFLSTTGISRSHSPAAAHVDASAKVVPGFVKVTLPIGDVKITLDEEDQLDGSSPQVRGVLSTDIVVLEHRKDSGISNVGEVYPLKVRTGNVESLHDGSKGRALLAFSANGQELLSGSIVLPDHGEEEFVIETVSRGLKHVGGSRRLISYHRKDEDIPQEMKCGAHDDGHSHAVPPMAPVASVTDGGRRLQLYFERVLLDIQLDAEFIEAHGGACRTAVDAMQQILLRINEVYSRDVGMSFLVGSVLCDTDGVLYPPDPFSAATDLMVKVVELWSMEKANPSSARAAADITHLLTGKNLLDGWDGYVGYAYYDTACSKTKYSTGVSMANFYSVMLKGRQEVPLEQSLAFGADLMAHELGHNLGARHCVGACDTTMGSTIKASLRFSPEAAQQIQNIRSVVSCYCDVSNCNVLQDMVDYTASVIPGILEAENFAPGGNGVAFRNTADPMDVTANTDYIRLSEIGVAALGSLSNLADAVIINKNFASEWTSYDVTVASDRTQMYTVRYLIRVVKMDTPGNTGLFLVIDPDEALGPEMICESSPRHAEWTAFSPEIWSEFVWVQGTPVQLSADVRRIILCFSSEWTVFPDVDKIEFALEDTAVTEAPPSPPPVVDDAPPVVDDAPATSDTEFAPIPVPGPTNNLRGSTKDRVQTGEPIADLPIAQRDVGDDSPNVPTAAGSKAHGKAAWFGPLVEIGCYILLAASYVIY